MDSSLLKLCVLANSVLRTKESTIAVLSSGTNIAGHEVRDSRFTESGARFKLELLVKHGFYPTPYLHSTWRMCRERGEGVYGGTREIPRFEF